MSAPLSVANSLTAKSLKAGAAPCGVRRTHVSGHFGEILQGRLGPGGPVVLLTLTAPSAQVRAEWRPARGAPLLTGADAAANWAAQGLRAGLRERESLAWGGRFKVATDLRPGGGCGFSTASLLAALRLSAPGLPEAREAAQLLALEGAVDPLMAEAPGSALWASRQARRIATFAPPPRLLVVGGYDGSGLRTDPACDDFLDVADLVGRAARAALAGDRRAFAAVATASAERRQAAAPKPRFAALHAIAEQTGALGMAAAHTGSAAGLLFAPDQREAAVRAATALREAGLQEVRLFLNR